MHSAEKSRKVSIGLPIQNEKIRGRPFGKFKFIQKVTASIKIISPNNKYVQVGNGESTNLPTNLPICRLLNFGIRYESGYFVRIEKWDERLK